MRISDWSSDVCSSDLICLASWPEKSPGKSVLKSAWLILSALIAGMLLVIGVELVSPAAGTASLPWIEPIGLLWLNALKMTIVPLIVALLITGITATADAARAGTLAFRAVMTFLGAIFLSGLMSLYRQSDVAGKSVSVRVDLGGRRIP